MLKLAGNILNDEYGIYTGYNLRNQYKQITWRRPKLKDVTDAINNKQCNAFYKSTLKLANELKILYLFIPGTIFTDAYWLFNNPRLMYLSTFHLRDSDTPNRNNISPIFGDKDFLKVYWHKEKHYYSELFNEILYPKDGEPSKINSSWLQDIYIKNKNQFNEKIRPLMKDYIDISLRNMDSGNKFKYYPSNFNEKKENV